MLKVLTRARVLLNGGNVLPWIAGRSLPLEGDAREIYRLNLDGADYSVVLYTWLTKAEAERSEAAERYSAR